MPKPWLKPRDIENTFRLPRSTVNDLLRKKKIPGAKKVGKTRWRVNSRVFSDWIRQNTVKVPKFSKFAYEGIQQFSDEFWEVLPDWLTPEEILDESSWTDSESPRSTFYENLKSGRIPGAIKIGRSWRINKPTLRGWKGEYSQGESISIAEAEAS